MTLLPPPPRPFENAKMQGRVPMVSNIPLGSGKTTIRRGSCLHKAYSLSTADSKLNLNSSSVTIHSAAWPVWTGSTAFRRVPPTTCWSKWRMEGAGWGAYHTTTDRRSCVALMFLVGYYLGGVGRQSPK